MSRRSAAYQQATARTTVDELTAALPDGAALVNYLEFWYYEPTPERSAPRGRLDRFIRETKVSYSERARRSLLALVVRKGRPVEMFNLGEMEPIEAAIDAWRVSYGVLPEGEQAGALLRRTVWDPLEMALGDATLVLVSPDGALGRLPLAALPGRTPGTYLLEEIDFSLIPVPKLIPTLSANPEQRELSTDLLVVGGVNYNRRGDDGEATTLASSTPPVRPWDRGELVERSEQRSLVNGKKWPFLDGTDGEAAFVRTLYQEAFNVPAGSNRIVALRGAKATEEALRAAAPQAYLLHIATHGFFATEEKRSARRGCGGE